MKREQIKDILLKMGASVKLLEMPAVMERIYNYYIDYNEDELRQEINITPNGEIECKKTDSNDMYPNGVIRGFYIEENGEEVVFENHEQQGIELKGRYFIDKFGMDRMFTDDSNPLFEQETTVKRTQNGTLEINGGKVLVEDQGDPILNYGNYTVLKENFSRSIGWQGNKEFLTKHYPITREWFEIREGTRSEEKEDTIVPEENVEVENLRNRIKVIEEQHRSEIDTLKKEKELLQNMLRKALDFCELVKRSAVGKVFFRKKIKELPEASNLDER